MKTAQVYNPESLPKLLYLSDVPVENHMHGSTLLYRALSSYPKEKLIIIEGKEVSIPDRRLRGVEYGRCKPVLCRLAATRFHNYIRPISTLCAPLPRTYLTKLLRSFEPEAVMTVVWGFTWATAAAFAERARLPLHLIVHDDSPNVEWWRAAERRVIHARLNYWYRKAASRLCISPYMENEYRRRYDAEGDVLYPSRATDGPVFTEPPDTLGQRCQPFTVAFAGTIYEIYADGLRRMAAGLRATCAGRLLVYGPGSPETIRSLSQEPNIELRGRLSAADLILQCRREAHAMFVPMTHLDGLRQNIPMTHLDGLRQNIPMTHLDGTRQNMRLSFPSKLADCTAMGLPLVIDGPEDCSAVRWARENQGVAEVTTEGNIDGLVACLRRLQDPAHRVSLARKAISLGEKYFAPNRAMALLYNKLTSHKLHVTRALL